MSGVVVHLLLPFLVVAATGLFRPKQALVWLPFAVVSDLDFIPDWIAIWFFGGDFSFHRALGHNLFLPAIAALIAWRIWRRHVTPLGLGLPEAWGAFLATKWGPGAVLASFYLFSHVLLDAFQGGAVLLWPLYNHYFYFRPILWINTKTLEPRPEITTETGVGAPVISPEYPWIVPEEVGIVLLALAGWVLVFLHRRNFGFWTRLAPDRVGPSPDDLPIVRRTARLVEKGGDATRPRQDPARSASRRR